MTGSLTGGLRRILVLRLGALGDFILSFGPFAAVRAAHAADEVTLLTTAPFAELARRSPWFDSVLVDRRPEWWDLPGLLRLSGQLRGYDRVYDLQTSRRSGQYFRLAGRPVWSGIAPGCALPNANPARDAMHTLERQREQLAMAGIAAFPAPDLSWLAASAAPLPVPEQAFALLVPGAAAHRPDKRWPAERFGALAVWLQGRGLLPIVVGVTEEAPLAAAIVRACPIAKDLTGRTDLFALAGLAARARVAIGNDTGPMHIAAATGCPCVVLFGPASDPALTAPRGPDGSWPEVLRAPDLGGLSVHAVTQRVAAMLISGP